MYGSVRTSKENILSYINEYDIFKYYISNFKRIGKLFCSELREDKKPTCSIAKIGDTLKYTDFGSELRSIDCFNYVKELYNINFYEALDQITVDFNLPLLTATFNKRIANTKAPIVHNINLDDIPEVTTSVIQVKIREFSLGDKAYWADKYQITIKDLRKFNIYPVEYYLHNDKFIKNKALTYGYYFGKHDETDRWKMYCPNAFYNDVKWRTNCSSDFIQGYDQLPPTGNLLIITKSLKDVVILDKLEICAIAPQAEFHLISTDILNELKRRFKKIIILYDNDDPGIKAATLHSELYQLPNVILPLEENAKDPSDYVELHGYDKLQKTLELLCGK